MLLVEPQVALVVEVPEAGAGRLDRTPAAMNDLGAGREENAAAPGAQRGAEVHVLLVHEIPLVEEAGIENGLPVREQTCAGDPVHVSLSRDETCDVPPPE